MNEWLDAELAVRSAADIAEFEKKSLSEWGLPNTTFEAIKERAQRMPNAVAIKYIPSGDDYTSTSSLTYGELLAAIARTANLLRRLGVGPRDRVGILLPNTPEAQICLWAAQTAGVACPINFMLEAVQIESILDEARCEVLIALGPDEDFDIWQKCADMNCSRLRHRIRIGGGPVDPGWIDWEEAQTDMRNELTFSLSTDPDGATAIFHTGGTTGKPKLAWHTHLNQVVNCWTQGVALSIKPGHVRVCGLPLFHVNGALANGLVIFMAGGSLVLAGKRGYRDTGVMRNFWRIIEHNRANSFAAVPTFLVGLMQIPVDGADVSSLEFVRCGTAPLSRQVASDFTAQTGVALIEGYGMTEATSISAMNPRFGEPRIGSVGLRIPYQQVQIRALADDSVRDAGEWGKVFVRGPNVIPGYLTDEDAVPENHGDWLDTGDLGYLDADEYLWLSGRAKDIIIRGGHNLDPRMIEEALYEHPAVEHAAAIGRPDRYTGEMPVAFVSLKSGTRIDTQALLDLCGERIPERAAVPKSIQILDKLPMTALGKIHKPELRKFAARDGYVDALGGMIGAYNLSMRIDDRSGGTLIRIHSTNLSPQWHEDVKRFINDALKTFTLSYELTFGDDVAAAPSPAH